MARAVQKRTLETRARLLAVSGALVAEGGYEQLRVEEVVLRAGVAKGTFFAHFRDKDALMDILIGARINAIMDDMEPQTPPETVADVVDMLTPLHAFMTSERYVFDIIMRYSGAAAVAEIGVIATTFGRYVNMVTAWTSAASFRKDITPELLAEGVQAFAIQAIALQFCALHSEVSTDARLRTYLDAWLLPPA